MLRFREAKWPGLSLVLVFIILSGFSDARAYRVRLSLDTQLHYEEYWLKWGSTDSNLINLGEDLKIGFSSYIYDPLLANYQLGFQLQNLDLFTEGSHNNLLNLGYNVSTAILPQSSIPLRLYARRIVSDHRYELYPSYEVISNSYGLNASVLRKNLPQVRVSLNHNDINFDSPFQDKDEIERRMLVDMFKRIGDFDLRGVFEYEDRQDLLANTESKTKRIRLEDITRFSPRASIFLDAQMLRSEKDSEDEASGAVNQYLQDDFDLGTRFHHRFDQKLRADYRYNFSHFSANNGAETMTNQAQVFFHYYITPRLDTTEGISLIILEDEQPENVSKTITEQGNMGIYYRRPFSRFYLYLGNDLVFGLNQIDPGWNGGYYSDGAQIQVSCPALRFMVPAASLSYTNARDNSSAGNDQDTAWGELRVDSKNIRPIRLFGVVRYEDQRESIDQERRESQNFSASLNGNYLFWFWGGLSLFLGYNRQDSQDFWSNRFFYQGDLTINPVDRFSISNSLRQDYEKTEGSEKNRKTRWESRIGYRIGRMALLLKYYYLVELQGDSETKRHAIFFELGRGFDWVFGS